MYLNNAAWPPASLAPARELRIGFDGPRTVWGASGGSPVWLVFRIIGPETTAGMASRGSRRRFGVEPLLLPSGARPSASTARHSVAPRAAVPVAPAGPPTASFSEGRRLADLVPGFLSLVGSIHRQAQAAAVEQDWPLAERLGHSLGHTASSHGFHQILDAARNVSQAAVGGDPARLRAALGQLEQLRRQAVRLPAQEAAALLCGPAQCADGVVCAAVARAAGA